MHLFTYHCLVGKGTFLPQQDIADLPHIYNYNYSAFDRNVVLHILILYVDKYCEVAQENYSLQAITWSPESVVLVGTMVMAVSEDKEP